MSEPRILRGRTVVPRVPAITDLDDDPCSVIATGDWVLIDNSTVEVSNQ